MSTNNREFAERVSALEQHLCGIVEEVEGGSCRCWLDECGYCVHVLIDDGPARIYSYYELFRHGTTPAASRIAHDHGLIRMAAASPWEDLLEDGFECQCDESFDEGANEWTAAARYSLGGVLYSPQVTYEADSTGVCACIGSGMDYKSLWLGASRRFPVETSPRTVMLHMLTAGHCCTDFPEHVDTDTLRCLSTIVSHGIHAGRTAYRTGYSWVNGAEIHHDASGLLLSILASGAAVMKMRDGLVETLAPYSYELGLRAQLDPVGAMDEVLARYGDE